MRKGRPYTLVLTIGTLLLSPSRYTDGVTRIVRAIASAISASLSPS